MGRIVDILLPLNVILICGMLVFCIEKASKNMTLPDTTKQLQDEKLRLEIKKLEYEVKLIEEQVIPVIVD